MLPVKADLVIFSPVTGLSAYMIMLEYTSVAFMLSYKMDFSSCGIMPGFGKSSHKYTTVDESLMTNIALSFAHAIFVTHIFHTNWRKCSK